MDTISKPAVWTGRILSILVSMMLIMDGVVKFMMPPPVAETFKPLGLPLTLATPLGTLILVCVLIYLIPRTAILGTVLLTGYLGGAIAIHLRVGDPLFSHTLFPVYIGILVWLGLYLRDVRLRRLFF